MASLRSEIEFVNACIDLIGQMGPKTVNCGIIEHNIFLEDEIGAEEYERLEKLDVITVGKAQDQ